MAFLQTPQPPRLPDATQDYNRSASDSLLNVLRLYFNRLSGVLNSVLGTNGGQYIDCPNGLFFNTAEQFFGATSTAYPIVYNQTYLNNAVHLATASTSRIQTDVGGVYNFQYSGQLLSDSASAKTAYLWIKRNGTNIGYSTHAYTLAANGEYFEISWNFNIDMQPGDYLELEMAVTDTNLHLHSEAATAVHPGIPSSVMSVNFIAPLPAELPTPP